MRLLITGFEPFGGSKINPTEGIARALHGSTINDAQIASVILPVDREGGPARLLDALRVYKPGAVLCLGQASDRACLSIERVAVNLLDYRIADNSGNLVTDEPVVPDGPAAYFSTLPVRAMLHAMKDSGIPAELSMSAGTYLCNQVMYVLLHALAQKEKPVPAGFIHVPALPQQAAESNRMIPSMTMETSVAGVRLAVEILSAHAQQPR